MQYALIVGCAPHNSVYEIFIPIASKNAANSKKIPNYFEPRTCLTKNALIKNSVPEVKIIPL